MDFSGGYDAPALRLKAMPEILAAIARLGRTEDLKFSPHGQQLAITGFHKNRLLILKLELTKTGEEQVVTATDYLEISSANLREPHGVSWIGEDALLVANRAGVLGVFQLPASWPSSRATTLRFAARITAWNFRGLSAPGSVSVFSTDGQLYEVLVCNNRGNTVSRHQLQTKPSFRFFKHETLFRAGLDIPDSVAHDVTGRFVAVSNHSAKCVNVYDLTLAPDETSGARGTLKGLNYPHGVRFSPDGKFIMVADAAEPFVHVYVREDGNWQGDKMPSASIRVMDDSAYARGHSNPEEGGPKGIDLWGNSGMLAVTCEETPVQFFDVSRILKTNGRLPASLRRTVSGVETAPWPERRPKAPRPSWRSLLGF